MRKKKLGLSVAPVVLGLGTIAFSFTALALPAMPVASAAAVIGTGGVLASPHSAHPNLALVQPVTDLGPADASNVVSVSIILKLQNQAKLARYITETETPGSANYHKFLSVSDFKSQFAPNQKEVLKLVDYLNAHGIQSYSMQDGLIVKAIAPASVFEQLFKVQIENFSMQGQQFYASNGAMVFPKEFQPLILTTVGLDNYSATAPLMMDLSGDKRSLSGSFINGPAGVMAMAAKGTKVTLPKKGSTATHIPGQFTSGDVANLYGVNPLYKQGIEGQGETIGIVSFANFHPKDAVHYWDAIHLKTKPGRIRQVIVDGGGQTGQSVGSGETALDVEQAGGLAPDANIVVYDGANTDQGFIDTFYQAASDNVVDTLSVSWGSPELFYTAAGQASQLQALHQAFMEAAAQGISVFAATGDSGAYDTNGAVPYPFVSKVVSVDAPSSDPYVTATGGLTLAGTYKMLHGWVHVPETRAWSWDYMTNYMNTYYGQYGLYTDNIFPAGGGGGVSAYWSVPSYQKGIPTLQKTAPGQMLVDNTTSQPMVYTQEKAGFAGRNTPDISLNADPNSGYLLYSTPDGGWVKNVGGTSPAAPQMSAMTALIGQYLGSRVGLLNPTLYTLEKAGDYGPGQPITDITAGSNWYYQAIPGYDQATGVGSPNVSRLAKWIKSQSPSSTKSPSSNR